MDICRTELPPRFPVPGASGTNGASAADNGHWASCWLFDGTHSPAAAGAEASK
jgi:peptide/nickel transport system ATP-binding protein